LSKERDRLADMLERQLRSGQVGATEILERLAEFDAFEATRRLPIHALISTIFAAVSAIASALAAYFTYAALQIPHN
jgi:hypothetical protein